MFKSNPATIKLRSLASYGLIFIFIFGQMEIDSISNKYGVHAFKLTHDAALLPFAESNRIGESEFGSDFGKMSRKISTFMPMRGRKDGRDELASEYSSRKLSKLLINSAYKETDGDSYEDYVNHLIFQVPQNSRRSGTDNLQKLAIIEQVMVPDTQDESNFGRVEPKLRRAFHAMRGKRFSSCSA